MLASVNNTPSSIGPVETRCGTIGLDLDLTLRGASGLRGAMVARTDQDGNATIGMPIPAGLPSRFDGVSVYFQAVSSTFTIEPGTGPPPNCSFDISTSNLGSTTLSIP